MVDHESSRRPVNYRTGVVLPVHVQYRSPVSANKNLFQYFQEVFESCVCSC